MSDIITDIGSNENDDDDEFECSECDYKCSSEDDMIKHSSIHTSGDGTIKHSLMHTDVKGELTTRNNNTTTCEYDKSAFSNSQSQFNIREWDEINKRLIEKSEINDHGFQQVMVKTEPSSCEEIYAADSYHERDIGRKKIKIENVNIKLQFQQHNQIDNHASLPYFQPETQYQNSQELLAPNIEFNGISDSANSAYNYMDIPAEVGSFGREHVDLNDKNPKLHNGLSLKQCLLGPNMQNLELDTDNTDIYIPPGWKRKIFLRSSLPNGQLRFDCYYFTQLGKKIGSRKEAHEYHMENPFVEIDIDNLNFSLVRSNIIPSQFTGEFDLINTEIYVPEGWQRKLNVSTNVEVKKKYKIVYINPEGKRFWCKSDVFLYLSHLEGNNKDYIDVESFDFNSRSFLNLSKGYIKNPDEDNTLIKSCLLSTEKDKLLTDSHFDVADNDKLLNHLFEDRKIFMNGGNYAKILCKLCSYLCNSKAKAHKHISAHIENDSDSLLLGSSLTNNFDHFICEACHEKIISRADAKLHLQIHSNEEISSSIIGAKYVQIGKYGINVERERILYCCGYCNFACPILTDMFKHVKEHSSNKHPNNIEKNLLNAIIEDEDLVNINQDKLSLKIKSSTKRELHTTIKDGDPKVDQDDSWLRRNYCDKEEIVINNTGNYIKKEIEIDNTGKYIPNGWERRVYHYNYIDTDEEKEMYKVCYISPLKISLSSKLHVYMHIKQLERSGFKSELEVEKMDFSILSQKIAGKKKNKRLPKCALIREEVKIGSTEIDIPEGWQLKLFKNKNGSNKGKYYLCYISPFNKQIWDYQTLKTHLRQLEKRGTPLLVDLDKISFSFTKHGLTKYRNAS